MDPFQGQQERHRLASSKDATSVRGAFHIVKLAGDAPGEVRRRVQQDTLSHRGRTGDPLYQIRNLLRACRDRLTKRQQKRLRAAFTADEAHISVEVAYHCAQQVRDVFHQDTPAQGRRLAARLVQCLPACPIPEIARLGADPTQVEGRTRRLLRHSRSQQRTAPKPSTDIIELGRRTARGYPTPPTTNSECSSSQEASTPPPTPNSEEPVKYYLSTRLVQIQHDPVFQTRSPGLPWDLAVFWLICRSTTPYFLTRS
nr:transposase [Actinomyces sp. ICM47]